MNEKTNEENTIYLVSIKFTELVFVTKAKNENEAKIFVARHLINNKSTYGNLTDIVGKPNYFDYVKAIKLSSVISIIDNAMEGHVSNVARMIQTHQN
jgi:hypothetical protein